MTASLFSPDDSASPTSALPSLESLTTSDVVLDPALNQAVADSDNESVSSTGSAASEYIAPLSGHAPDASIDGTSVGGGEGGIRPETKEEVTEDDKKEALRIKSEANALFSASKYRPSLDLYTASLNKNPFDSVVWSNRAAVRLKLEEHGLAIADATRALELDPRFVKALYRRALANLAIMKPKAALVDLRTVLKLEPANAVAKAQLDATQKLLRRLQFEAAISSKEGPTTSQKIREQLKDGASPIEQGYEGPRLAEDGRPTAEFVEGVMEWFKEGKVLPRRVVWEIVVGALDVLDKEESLVEVTIPEGETINVIGDTHGQFYDFLKLIELTGVPSPTHSLLFNGDFVDRGSWSTEIVIVLFAYKWLYPTKVFLNRGNHETSDMNKVYGFEGETKKKYSELTYKLFEEVFTCLPLATLVHASKPPPATEPTAGLRLKLQDDATLHDGKKRFFVVHGGLFSREDVKLDEIRKIPRKALGQPGQEGLMCEMLWCDPQEAPGRGPSKRGVGIGFGPDVTKRWTELNEVTAVIRSHEVQQGGYSVTHRGRLITVFSAPNYVDQVGNSAAFATIDADGELVFTTFKEVPHPTHIRPMQYAQNMGF